MRNRCKHCVKMWTYQKLQCLQDVGSHFLWCGHVSKRIVSVATINKINNKKIIPKKGTEISIGKLIDSCNWLHELLDSLSKCVHLSVRHSVSMCPSVVHTNVWHSVCFLVGGGGTQRQSDRRGERWGWGETETDGWEWTRERFMEICSWQSKTIEDRKLAARNQV